MFKTRMTKAEHKFIDEHEHRYTAAYGRAMLRIKQDSRFTGLEKVRDAMAHTAAMAAIQFPDAYPKTGLKLPSNIGEPTADFMQMCEELLNAALDAAWPDPERVHVPLNVETEAAA